MLQGVSKMKHLTYFWKSFNTSRARFENILRGKNRDLKFIRVIYQFLKTFTRKRRARYAR